MDSTALSRPQRSRWIPDGVYVVRFRSPVDQSSGVVTLRGGRATGGDSSFYYDGVLEEGPGGPVARMLFVRYRTGSVSVVGEIDRFTVTFSGRSDDNLFYLEGRMNEAPGLILSAIMTRLPVDLDADGPEGTHS